MERIHNDYEFKKRSQEYENNYLLPTDRTGSQSHRLRAEKDGLFLLNLRQQSIKKFKKEYFNDESVELKIEKMKKYKSRG